MKNSIKYTHTNLIAHDWKKLAQFYTDVFDCKPYYPERNLSGEWIEKLTNIQGVHVRGIHLHLPGYENGPTLEIFEYNIKTAGEIQRLINLPGFGHIAFHVNDLEGMLNFAISKGATKYGETIEKEITGIGTLNAVYIKDPEGNIVELQNWKI